MVAIVQRLVHRIVVPMTWVQFPVATHEKTLLKLAVFLVDQLRELKYYIVRLVKLI